MTTTEKPTTPPKRPDPRKPTPPTPPEAQHVTHATDLAGRRVGGLVLLALTLVTLLVDLVGGGTDGSPWRMVLTTAFVLTAPGWSLVAYARRVSPAFLWSVGVALSIAVGILFAEVMLLVHLWHPRAAMLVLATVTLVPLAHQVWRVTGVDWWRPVLARVGVRLPERTAPAPAIERIEPAADAGDVPAESPAEQTVRMPAIRPDDKTVRMTPVPRRPASARIDPFLDTTFTGNLELPTDVFTPVVRDNGDDPTAVIKKIDPDDDDPDGDRSDATKTGGAKTGGAKTGATVTGAAKTDAAETRKGAVTRSAAQPARSDGKMVLDGIWLSLGAAFTSVAGLIGWVISAKLNTRDLVGETAAFTSGFLLVSSLSQLSLGPAVLRWLPRAGRRSAALLTRVYLVLVVAALIGAGIFVALPAGRHALGGLPGWGIPMFIGTTLAWALLQFQDFVLTSFAKAGTVLAKNVGFGIGRVGILIIAGAGAGALGIVLSWAIPALLAALSVSLVVVRGAARRRKVPGGKLPDRAEITNLLGPTYVATIGQSLLYYLLPLIVTGRMGAADGAVFFVVWTAVTALDVAGTAFVNSLVVRVSAHPARVGALTRMAGTRLAMLFGPVMLLGAAVAYPLLAIFGHDYAVIGATTLRLVLIGCLPRLLVLLAIGVCQAQGKGVLVAGLQLASAGVMIPLGLLVPPNLADIGLGFVIVQVGVAIAAALVLRSRTNVRQTEETMPIIAPELAS